MDWLTWAPWADKHYLLWSRNEIEPLSSGWETSELNINCQKMTPCGSFLATRQEELPEWMSVGELVGLAKSVVRHWVGEKQSRAVKIWYADYSSLRV